MNGRVLRALVLPVALLIVAEVAGRATGYRSDALALPSVVLMAFVTGLIDGSWLAATGHTLFCAAAGLAIGGGLGLLVGVAAGSWRVVAYSLSPTVEALRPVPPVALIPLMLLLFGFGLRMEIAAVAFGCLWPMLILTRGAVAAVEPGLGEVARMLRLGPAARFAKITLPAALPRILVGLRLAAGIALIIAVTAEITANPHGLGYAMMEAEQTLRPEAMLAQLLWIGVLGWAINAALLYVQDAWLGAAARSAPR